ncbi:MAG: Gfo/Idh/MocA family oxidoreductase [Pirellulales bacterium]
MGQNDGAQEAPSDRVNIGAIGVGGRGSGIGHQAGQLGNLVAVADVDANHASRFAAKYQGRCEVYEDYRRLLEHKDIDAITCGTPDHWHTKIAIDAMRAGKDVYCEKPLTLTIDESQQIMQVTHETGRVFQVGTQQRSEFDQRFLKAVVIARSGRLGNKLHAISSVGPAGGKDNFRAGPYATSKPPSHLNFDFWLGQAPLVEYCPERTHWNFRWWQEYSGGQIADWGVHHTDIALWALGGEQTGVATVEGHGTFPGLPYTKNVLDFLNGRIELPNRYNVAKNFDCHMKLPNDNTINLVSKRNELIIEGNKGKIRVNRGGLSGKPVEEIAASGKDSQWLKEEVAKLYRHMPFEKKHDGHLVHMSNFFHCIKTREMPISDVWTHCNTVNACHMANIAMLLKRKVHFDFKQHHFTDDDQANQFLKRKQRPGYAIT